MKQLRLVGCDIETESDPLAPIPFTWGRTAEPKGGGCSPHPAEIALERAQAKLDDLSRQVGVLARLAPGRWTQDDGPRAA